ncbi:hypothetical protein BU24DRAFT_195276 [Aaosphaeria arxii CBS 175.79]|uniref:Uncharacterized protein n=1 Tax=Aaosphaeria arxii CBS 175.79 TaxID=1450172 RepID=A0A6A5XTM4_9PLEO|nr:uncharacterized protein BU24DRAFT_195276 [Aaosphaeria arxii CBS 175.79]KAF2016167.1 hypothetical protein BU24DRAFT_195276 [Aaosphaeria arxii CBS 175.79]
MRLYRQFLGFLFAPGYEADGQPYHAWKRRVRILCLDRGRTEVGACEGRWKVANGERGFAIGKTSTRRRTLGMGRSNMRRQREGWSGVME